MHTAGFYNSLFEHDESLLPEESLGARVHAGGGLVEQHHLRLAHHAHRIAQLATKQHAHLSRYKRELVFMHNINMHAIHSYQSFLT